MAYTDNLLTDEQDDVLTMNPSGQMLADPEGADYEDEGSGSTSGYGDTTEDDLLNEDDLDDEPLETDPDDDLRGDDLSDDDDDI